MGPAALAEAFVHLVEAFVLRACSLDSPGKGDTGLAALSDSLAGDSRGQGNRPDRAERTAGRQAEPHKSERRVGAGTDWERRPRSRAHWPKYLAAEAAAAAAGAECMVSAAQSADRRTAATSRLVAVSAGRQQRPTEVEHTMRVDVMMEAARREVVAEMEHSMVDWDRCWLQPPGSAEEFGLDWARNHMSQQLLRWAVRPMAEAVAQPDLVVTREDVPFRLAVAAAAAVQTADSLRVPVGMEAAGAVADMVAERRQPPAGSLAARVAVFVAAILGRNLDRNSGLHSHSPLAGREER